MPAGLSQGGQCGAGRAGRRKSPPARRRDRRAAGPLGVRQIHPAADRCWTAAADRGTGAVVWQPAPRAGGGRGDGVSKLRPVPLAHCKGKCGTRIGSARAATGRTSEPCGASHRPDRAWRFRRRLSEGVVGRHEPARGSGARAGGASRPAADGRAVQCAGRADCRDAAHGSDRFMVGRPVAAEIGADGNPQYRGSGADGRPHPGVFGQSGPHRARACGAVCASTQPP